MGVAAEGRGQRQPAHTLRWRPQHADSGKQSLYGKREEKGGLSHGRKKYFSGYITLYGLPGLPDSMQELESKWSEFDQEYGKPSESAGPGWEHV
jgi:hypothetical protein